MLLSMRLISAILRMNILALDRRMVWGRIQDLAGSEDPGFKPVAYLVTGTFVCAFLRTAERTPESATPQSLAYQAVTAPPSRFLSASSPNHSLFAGKRPYLRRSNRAVVWVKKPCPNAVDAPLWFHHTTTGDDIDRNRFAVCIPQDIPQSPPVALDDPLDSCARMQRFKLTHIHHASPK
jgi:hypothetical protein